MATVDYARDVKPFDDDMAEFGSTWTDGQIANIIEGETFNPISVGNCREHMAGTEWWVEQQSDWVGQFQSYKDDPATDPQIVGFLDDIWSIVFALAGRTDVGTTLVYNRRGKISPANKQGARLWKEFFAWSRSNASPLVEDDITDFYSLGGGLKYGGEEVTNTDVADARTAWLADQNLNSNKVALSTEYNRLYNIHIAPIQASDDPLAVTDQAYKDALQQMSVNWVDQL